MPAKKSVEPVDVDYIHNMPPSEDRGNRRSVTPEGFALAVMRARIWILMAKALEMAVYLGQEPSDV